MERRTVLSFFIGIALFALMLTMVIHHFGNLDSAIRWLNGESFCIYPKVIHLEDTEPGKEELVTFHLQNLTSKEVSVVGVKSSCSCVASVNIPVAAKPKETIELNIRAVMPREKSRFDQTVLFMVSTQEKIEVSPVRITASVSNPVPKTSSESPQIRPGDLSHDAVQVISSHTE